MKKFLSFFGLCFYVVGAIGGFGVSAYNKEWFIAVCVAMLAVFAFPKLKEFWKELTS